MEAPDGFRLLPFLLINGGGALLIGALFYGASRLTDVRCSDKPYPIEFRLTIAAVFGIVFLLRSSANAETPMGWPDVFRVLLAFAAMVAGVTFAYWHHLRRVRKQADLPEPWNIDREG